MTASATPDQYDTPWKEAVERYFPEFMAFYFPQAHSQIDWNQGYTFLEQELQAVVQDAELGKRFVDKLVRVTRLSGQEDWIYIHLEVQGAAQAEFAERMFVYNYRIYDRYRRPVASMACSADDSEDWKPQTFGYDVFNCQMGIRFPVAKLTDYAGRESSLEEDLNAFALVTLAHLQTRATRKDPQARYEARLKLVRLLYERNWERQRIIDLFYVLEWLMKLPEHLNQQLLQSVQNLEQEKKMAYVSSIERMGIEKGMQQGMQEGMQQGIQEGIQEGMQQGMQKGEGMALQKLLAKRFGPLQPGLTALIAQASLSEIESWFDRAIDASSLVAVFGDALPRG